VTIRQLPEHVVNRIAAGEVVERPASVVKELVENALDAGARRIDVVTAGGGKSLIRVADDGAGIRRTDLKLAVARHCTSKLPTDDLSAIATLGFRGEALASIGSVARLAIQSRHASEDHAWRLEVEAGRLSEPAPASRPSGTQVEVRDLFFAIPARLKFLRSDRAEASAVTEVVRRLALVHGVVPRPCVPPDDRSGRLGLMAWLLAETSLLPAGSSVVLVASTAEPGTAPNQLEVHRVPANA